MIRGEYLKKVKKHLRLDDRSDSLLKTSQDMNIDEVKWFCYLW